VSYDSDVLDAVRDSFSAISMDTPAGDIAASGRSRRRRRRAKLVVTGLATAGLLVAVPALAGSSRPDAPGGAPLSLAAFTVVKNSDGTATLTLTKGQTFDTNALRQELAQAGVPAVVNVGRTCVNQDSDGDQLDAVVNPQRDSDGGVVLIFTLSAMPQGSELSISRLADHTSWQLVNANAPLTCTSEGDSPESGNDQSQPAS
jgi:hypothetical protein